MPAMTSVIIEKRVSICFLTFYVLQCRRARGNFPLYLHSRRARLR